MDDEVLLQGATITPSTAIKSLGIHIDHRLSFRIHIASAIFKAAKLTSMVATLTKIKCISRKAIHQLAQIAILSNLLWGSEAWWTKAEHITRQLGPMYNRIARYITNLPKWTKTTKLLLEAGLPPLQPLLDFRSGRYGIRTLLLDDGHPAKTLLLDNMARPRHTKERAGMGRIADLNKDVTKDNRIEDTTSARAFKLPDRIITTSDKETEAKAHKA